MTVYRAKKALLRQLEKEGAMATNCVACGQKHDTSACPIMAKCPDLQFCEWKEEWDKFRTLRWQKTSCGERYTDHYGGFRFCPYCGKPIKWEGK